jgi:hypothetical protein
MWTLPLNLKCFEYRRRLDGGVTRPLLVAAEDNKGKEYQVVLKLRHPDVRGGHYEGTSLARELICSMVARAIGLPVPDYAIVELSDALLNPYSIGDEKLRRLLGENIGLNFGSVYEESARKWQPESDFYTSPADAQEHGRCANIRFDGYKRRP